MVGHCLVLMEGRLPRHLSLGDGDLTREMIKYRFTPLMSLL